MPEYLAPGVYIEEIEIGAKPIEGVSTSTAGFLGIAEKATWEVIRTTNITINIFFMNSLPDIDG